MFPFQTENKPQNNRSQAGNTQVANPELATLAGETCEQCGGSVFAKHVAYKNTQSLYFCAHHTREYAEGLTSQGFTIYPENYSL